MDVTKGDKFRLNGEEHMVDAVVGNDVYVERLRDNSIKKYTLCEVVTLITESNKKGWYTGPWPIITTHYLHDERYALDEELKEMGVSEEDRRLFKYIVNELEIKVELHKNGDVYIRSVDGITLPEKIKTN